MPETITQPRTMVDPSRLLTIKQAARFLNTSVSKVRADLKTKKGDKIPHFKLPGRGDLRFKYDELLYWLENRRGA